MNVICLMGRLTADPELRHTPSQVAVTTFSLAVDRAYQPKGQERQTDFINVVAWRGTAEFICNYFRKGQRMALQGSLQSRNYTDKEGNKRTAYEVVADNVYFAESKKESSSPARYESQVPPAFSNAGNTTASAFSNTSSAGDFEEIVGDDELPF